MSSGPLLLDTHCWIWMQFGLQELFSARGLATLREAARQARLLVSVISVWEVALLESKGRIHLWVDCHTWVREALATPGLTLAPLTPEIAVASTRLPGDLHGDPADRLIIATARAHGATLLTKDTKLLAYGRAGHASVMRA
jgi:PIN domain nuclease of toxin-antitoxin system